MQVAAANPRCVSREDVPAEVIEQERQIYATQSADKPEAVVKKIVDGKLGKVLPRHLSQRTGLGARPQPHHQ